MNPDLMTINEVAMELGWSRTTICRLIDEGVLEVVVGVHKNRRVRRRTVLALIYGSRPDTSERDLRRTA